MFLSKLGYSELVQRIFEKMTFFLVDPLSSSSRRVSACHRHLVTFFSRRCTYLSSSWSRWSPRVSVYYCLGRHRCSIVLMGERRHRCRHRPPQSVVVHSLRRAPTLAFARIIIVDVAVIDPPPGRGVRTGRTKDCRRWSANPPLPKSVLTESVESMTRRWPETLM